MCTTAALASAGWAAPAEAYTIGSLATDACHERMTQSTLRKVRRDVEAAMPRIGPSADEQALIDDLPWDLPSDLADLEAATLLLANRDVDLHGVGPGDLSELATVNADPERQTHSCLRGPEHDEPNGTPQALDECREFARSRASDSITGLGDDGTPDARVKSTFAAVLSMRGSVEVALPRFWVEAGRALHTLQDSFSHAYRTHGDQLEIVSITNFVDLAEGRLVEERDGPPHNLTLDECTELDELRAKRLALAELASEELLRALLEPATSPDERMLRVDGVLDRYMSLSENFASCSAANGWCDAPERLYDEPGCACTLSGRRQRNHATLLYGLAVLALLCRRRRARARAAVAFATATLVLYSRGAQAAPTDEPSPFGAELAMGASVSHGALAVSLGGRYRVSSRFLAGLDAEYNPWFSLSVGNMRAGTTNLYATAILRFPMRSEPIALRSTLELGIARMNFHLVGVPEGSVGPFIGFNLLGMDYRLSRSLHLVLNPAHVVIPMPQVETVPFTYMQYRITVGLQYGASFRDGN